MSMIRQMALIFLAVVLLAVGGSIAVGAWSTRQALQEQWQTRNSDAATMLALALTQQKGDQGLLDLVLSAQFDTGHYHRIRLMGPGEQVLFERVSPDSMSAAPSWLPQLVRLTAPEGTAIVTDGWKTIGRVQVSSQSAWAYDSLWSSMLRSMVWLVLVGVGAMSFALALVMRWRRGLDKVLAQAQALEAGRFEELAEPRTAELQRLTAGMNSMVRRMHALV